MSGALQLKGPGLKRLQKLGLKLQQMEKLKRQIAAAQAEEALTLIGDGFKRETDPYGKKWPKRKRETSKTRGRKVLSGTTSRLQRGWHRKELSARGFKLRASVGYAAAHQRPKRRRRPTRAMVPKQGRGVPKRWAEPLREAAADTIEDFLKG